MTLRTKTWLGICLIWGSYLLLAWTSLKLLSLEGFIQQYGLVVLDYFLVCFLVLGIILLGITLWCLNILIFKRLEKINKNINQSLIENEFTHRLKEIGSDELTSITKEFNRILDVIETSDKKFDDCLIERTKDLQQHNTQLQQKIAEQKSLEKELISHKEHLVKLAHYDNLTSLPNRVFFNEMLNKTIKHATRHKKMMAVLFIDLDRFKNINDAFGHAIGDRVLKEIADRFSAVLRAGDILARLGGDEFIILLNDITHGKFASPVAEKLLQSCSTPIKIENQEFSLTASIGISLYPNDGISLEDLQRNADIAMYKAKRAGSGIFQYFTKEMNLEAHEHIQMEVALRKAISNNEFVLHYQPKLNLKDGSIAGVEALIRWENPELGLITPTEFIPLAEETGLIMQIGEWALREACQTNKAWQTEGYQPICVAVNLSAKQFQHPDIAQLVASILSEAGLEPQYLELELTETAVMENVESAINKLNTIKQMGVKISVDDFGTGYTSISYLKQFPISVLKIDQSFIKNIPENLNNTAITSAVIALAHTLEMKVVAEGVENAEQLQYLADHDCDMVQGYYLSRPLPEQKIVLQFPRVGSVEKNNESSSIA